MLKKTILFKTYLCSDCLLQLNNENEKLQAANTELQRQRDNLEDDKDDITKDKDRQIKENERWYAHWYLTHLRQKIQFQQNDTSDSITMRQNYFSI